GVRRHTKARRHTDASDVRQLPQVRALAADDRDLRRVDLLETQHVAVGLEGVDPRRIASSDHRRMLLRAHRVAPFAACGERVWSTPRGLKQAPPAAILWMWRGPRRGVTVASGAPGGDPEAVAVRVHERALPPGEPFLIDGNAELLGDGVDVPDVEMDQGVRPSVALVLGQVDPDVAPSHRDEPRETRLE